MTFTQQLRHPVGNGAPCLIMSKLGGRCNTKRTHIRMLSNVAYAIGHNRIYIVLNPSNSNGSAFLGLVNNLRNTSNNDVTISNYSLAALSTESLNRCHHHRLNFIFRFCGLIPSLAVRRGVRIATRLSGGPLPVRSLLHSLNL